MASIGPLREFSKTSRPSVRAVGAHVENERTILALIPPASLATLNEHLSVLLSALQSTSGKDSNARDQGCGIRTVE